MTPAQAFELALSEGWDPGEARGVCRRAHEWQADVVVVDRAVIAYRIPTTGSVLTALPRLASGTAAGRLAAAKVLEAFDVV
jgi:hypothetical protein